MVVSHKHMPREVASCCPNDRHPVTLDCKGRAAQTTRRKSTGVFAVQLHEILRQSEQYGFDHIISWASHGRCFRVHNPKLFLDQVLSRFFRLSELSSFRRQLNLYGFRRLTRGKDRGSYYNELFFRGHPSLAQLITRIRVNGPRGCRYKANRLSDIEPDLYLLPPIVTHAFTKADSCAIERRPAAVINDSQQSEISILERVNVNVAPTSPLPYINCAVALDDVVDEVFFSSKAVDFEMLQDFCSEWSYEVSLEYW